MVSKIILLLVLPLILSLFFHGNILTQVGFPIESVAVLFNQFADVITLVGHLSDYVLVEGTLMMLFRMWILWSMARMVYNILNKIFQWST